MTREDLTNFIERDVTNFWNLSINPINSDSTLLQHGINTLNAVRKEFDAPDSSWIINTFLNMSYLIKGEYFMSYMNNMILTNRRLFIWFKDLKKVIPLYNLQTYDDKNSKLIIQYKEDGALQTIEIGSKWLNSVRVNNTLNKHKSIDITPEELILIGNTKPVLDSLYNLSEFISPYADLSSISNAKEIFKQTNTQNIPVVKTRKNYSQLISICIFLLLMGGCVYWATRPNSNDDSASASTNSNISNASATNSNEVVNLNSTDAVNRYLTSKTFRYNADNMSIKFYPEGYYELSHNYQVSLTGKYTASGGSLLLESDEGNLNMTLSSDGTITDNASARVFQ